MRKYFFFDYDGTLAIPRTYTIPESTQKALQELQDQGHFIALATGRLQCNALDYINSMGIQNIVADGGFSVTINGKLIWMEPLELSSVKECLRRLELAGIPWAVTVRNELARYSPDPRFAEIAGDYYVPTKIDESLDVDSLECVYKAYVPCKQGKEQDELIESGILDGVPWARYNSDNIFIEPLDKARGIRRMMEELGASDKLSDVVVFGDGKNDLSMFSAEWTSIAMGNAIPELKACADYVTADCDKGGIYDACKHFGWL